MTQVTPKSSQNSKWLHCDLSDIFSLELLHKHFKEIAENDAVVFINDKTPPPAYNFPDFGAHKLQVGALEHICSDLRSYLCRAVTPVSDIPSVIVTESMGVVWQRVLQCVLAELVSEVNIKRVVVSMEKELEAESGALDTETKDGTSVENSPSLEKQSGNDVLIEAGVRTGLTVVFTLLKQAWSQLAWQRQIEQSLSLLPMSSSSSSLLPFGGQITLAPQISLPNEILKSILDILKSIPPLALSNEKSLSKLGISCLKQSSEFLDWILTPDSMVDSEGKRLALEIGLSLVLQQGSLLALIEWKSKMLLCLMAYREVSEEIARPCLSVEFCRSILDEIRKRTQLRSLSSDKKREARPFEPKDLSAEGCVSVMEFLLFLARELAEVCQNCTSYFSDQCSGDKSDGEQREQGFLSETSEVYAFGSNSSSQLAMGSTEKFLKASNMQHMANVQVVHAGQYCSFLIFGDGSVKACGKGSYGRLGLGNSDSQSTLKVVDTFPAGTSIRNLVSSRGSDGHTLGVTAEGQLYSWGDGNYGKLGHGDNVTHKLPKLIEFFVGKVVRHVSCGNRHTAAVTADGELFTWGEGDHGRLGHGNTSSHKSPMKVEGVTDVREVSCGVAHTLVLSRDGLTVWSFGSGDSGKLGHGDTTKQMAPKVIEALRGMMCQRVRAASQFSLVLTAGGKVYSFGNGSGVGKGTTEPRQYTPWVIEGLEDEMVIDISTGDGHCLALTQRGEVFAWGTNSMGQCGQSHNNGSITTPARVQGLEGVHAQQISAGTSHSVVWTAVPMDRRASAMWHWPYCVSVGVKTFKNLIDLLNQYGDIGSDNPVPPFTDKDSQESFLHSLLTLTHVHINMVAPLGPSCVRIACGSQVKPLRNLLFKFMDSQLPPALDQVASDALEVGSSVLLPPVTDRLDLLLSILPTDPTLIASLTTGQCRQLNILLKGFSDRNEFVGLIVEKVVKRNTKAVNPHTHKLHTLCKRIIAYLQYSVFSTLKGSPLLPDLELGSSLMTTFEQFIVSVFVVSFGWIKRVMKMETEHVEISDVPLSQGVDFISDTVVSEVMTRHFGLFYDILKDHSLLVLKELTECVRGSDDPLAFLQQKKDVLLGFLAYQFPTHVCLISTEEGSIESTYSIGDLLLELAACVHEIVSLFPHELVKEMESVELQWEPLDTKPSDIDLTKLRNPASNSLPWTKVMDFERLLCRSSAKFTKYMYSSKPLVQLDLSRTLEYSPSGGRGKLTLSSSHLLCNGLVGNEQDVADAISTWISLCKHLLEHNKQSEAIPDDKIAMPDNSPLSLWFYYNEDYAQLYNKFQEIYSQGILPKEEDIKPCDLKSVPALLALSVGSKVNVQATGIYERMMEMAACKDWNTCSDEDSVPQLRQVSCAALACLLKHTGLFTCATKCSTTKPKKKLVDVYRAVFSLRREVFTNRPIPDSEGKVSSEDQIKFQACCNGICVTLMFLTCVIDAALPEETDPIVPQIGVTMTATSISADDVGLRSPGSSTHRSRFSMRGPPLRLLSHPEIVSPETSLLISEPLPIQHSTSLSPASTETQGWSLPAVKQALSHLRWQRDRLDHLHATSSVGSEGSPHNKICSMIVDTVSAVFGTLEAGKEKTLLIDRVLLVENMLNQQRKAVSRRKALRRIVDFVSKTETPGYLLTSSRIAFLSACVDHSIHYSDGISAAPSVLQHEVKNLSHCLLKRMVLALENISGPQLFSVQRKLLLALQWSNFKLEPSDLRLLFGTNLDLYSRVVSLSGVVTSCVDVDMPMPSSRLASRLRMACVLMMQLLSVQVGLKSDVLKSSPEILSLISEHLFGQLEGFVNSEDSSINERWESRECTIEEREELLGEFLTFVNTLSATHEAMRSVLASDRWFKMLLRIVDIDTTTGTPLISSLKTRLLALQALGAIMADHSDTSPEAKAKCAKIIDDLLELVSRCMFLAPLSHFRDKIKAVQEPTPALEPEVTSVPFTVDPINQNNCTVATEQDGRVVIVGTGSHGHAMALTGLMKGKYCWKVSVMSANAAFCVGVSIKPLTDITVGTSDQFWLFEAHTGRLLHGGESGDLLPTLSEGDSVTIEYDADQRTLAFGKNDAAVAVAFTDVMKLGMDLFPVFRFNRRQNVAKVCVHPFSQSFVGGKFQEMTSSGYPLLSPTGTTLVQAVMSILYQVQHKEPWNKAIAHVVTSRLSEMDTLIHRLLDLKMEIKSHGDGRDSSDELLTPLSLLMAQLTQVVWPCLAVLGGVDTGFCLGRTCQVEVKGELVTAQIVSLPDNHGKVKVQELVTTGTDKVKKRSCNLTDLKLVAQNKFSLPLILDRLTPSILLNLAHLAGYLDKEHSLLSILQSVRNITKDVPKELSRSVPYHHLCCSLLQTAATTSLHTLLFDESVIKLLTYQPPSLQVVIAGDFEDKSELASAVKEILKCLSSRAIRPSPLTPTLRLFELERVHAMLGHQTLAAVAEHVRQQGEPQSGSLDATPTPAPPPPPLPPPLPPLRSTVTFAVTPPGSLLSSGSSGEDLAIPIEESNAAVSPRASTPPIVNMLMDMGFPRELVNIAIDKCEIPPNSSETSRTQLLVSWIIDHPNAVAEEEARVDEQREQEEAREEQRLREEQQQQEADRDAAATEFLSIVGEMLDPCESPTVSEDGEEKSTGHAPYLLEGPDIDEDVPDISLSGLDSSPESLKSLLFALGLSNKHPTPKRFEFSSPDPLGENICKVKRDEDSSEAVSGGDGVKKGAAELHQVCTKVVEQISKLQSLDEHLLAIDRVAAATQTLVARRVTMLVIASLSTLGTTNLISSLQALDLVNIQSLVRLLRLVDAGRIDGTPGDSFSVTTPSSLLPIKGLDCISTAITTAVTQSIDSGMQLMQSCSRDLLAAAVGGAKLLQRAGRRRGQRRQQARSESGGSSGRTSAKSDISVLSNPNFSVTRNLVQTLAKSTSQVSLSANSSGMLQIIDALAACLFSSKLNMEHRFWALEQLLKVFSSNGVAKREQIIRESEGCLLLPSQLEHLVGHKGQIMNCAESNASSGQSKRVITIGEDNSVILWDLQGGLNQPETTTLTMPTPSAGSRDSPDSQHVGLLLPTLTQSFNGACVAGAVDDTLCVWRTRDGKAVTEKFNELITALQWKPSQKEGESPILLVGLIDGEIELVEVHRSSGVSSPPPEIHTTKIERWIKGAACCLSWSPNGSAFAVGSTSSCVQIYIGSGREYSVTTDIKEIKACSLCWSPDESFLTTIENDGGLKLWDVYGEVPVVVHSFDTYPTNYTLWHPLISNTGNMLLASGSKDGFVHLWTIQGKRPSDISENEPEQSDQSDRKGLVCHVTSLKGHPAPITSLAFSERGCLLASGCKAGSVRVWDLQSLSLLKFVTRYVGEVLNMSWTCQGLAICYNNTSSLCILPPSPEDYLGERCVHSCLPMLRSQGISEPDKAPCLTALLRNLHLVLQDQYTYEEAELSSSQQLVHSEYLQLLTSLAVGLGLHTVFLSPPHPPHTPHIPPTKEWVWLANFTRAVKVAEALSKRTALPDRSGFCLPLGVDPLPSEEKYQTNDNSVWTITMDTQILEWLNQQPQDWWRTTKSNVYTWGKGTWNQLGHSTRERATAALADDWTDVQQIVAGSYCTYAIKFDGTVCSVGEGSYGRLGHGGSENEAKLRVISALQGIPVVQVIAGSRVSTSTDDGFALALTDCGDVFSWGKEYKGRLGHSSTENVRVPKMIEAFCGKEVKMIACCDFHCAVLTTSGDLYTMGSKEHGKLGRGRDVPSGSLGVVGKVEKFLDSDEQTEIEDVKIGYVSCGSMYTLAISQDGSRVFACGKSDDCAFGRQSITGDHHQPVLLAHLTAFGPFKMCVSGNKASALITEQGKVCFFGHLGEGGTSEEAKLVEFPNDEKIVDLATAVHHMDALSETGNVYYWGKNQFGTSSTENHTTPKLIEALTGKNLKQISAGVRHCAVSDTTLPVRGVSNITAPSSVPNRYSSLKDISCTAIHNRMLLLNYFSKLITSSWKLFQCHTNSVIDNTKFHINPLTDGNTRSLLSPTYMEGLVAGAMSRTMNSKQHGPSVNVTRITHDDESSKAVFPQLATQVLQKSPPDLRCSTRAWKVNLAGEGADDAGGVFDEIITQMCEELEKGVVKLLIQTPNARNKCGFNTDRFVFDPSCTLAKDMKHLKFCGVLFGVAIRTKKPLDLHLAQPMWKLLAGMLLTAEDLEEIDMIFIQTMYGIRDIHKSGMKEEDFSEMIPIETFETQSMTGKFVPIVPGGGNIKFTFQNRKEYVEKALQFRLHELDQQIAAVREGMSLIVPVPLLSLYTSKMLERAVCGSEEVDLQMLKKVVRYRDGTTESSPVVTWLWQTLESFTNEERILFLRFVSGRSRLPVRVSDITQRFQISIQRQVSDNLPTSQTCFFQLRLPTYTSKEVLADRLRYAILHCRSIDMDTYMLRGAGGDLYDDDTDDDYDDYYDD